MEKKISSLEIVIDGTSFFYEAHTYPRIVEILSGTLDVLKFDKTGTQTIDSFTVHYFNEVK